MSGLIVLETGRYYGGELLCLRSLSHQKTETAPPGWEHTFKRNSEVMQTNGFNAAEMRARNAELDAGEIARKTGFDWVSVNATERCEEIAVQACRKVGFGEVKPDAIIVCQSQSDSQADENSSVALRLQNDLKIKGFSFGIMDQEASAGVRALDLAKKIADQGEANEILLCGVQRIVPPFPRILTGHTVLGDGAAACRLSTADETGWCVDFTDLGSVDGIENPWIVFSGDIDVDEMADSIADFVFQALDRRGLEIEDFNLIFRSGLNAHLDRRLRTRLAGPFDGYAFPADLGYFGSADLPMMLDALCTKHQAAAKGKTCLMITAGFGGRIGLVALSYRRNVSVPSLPSETAPVYLHGSSYYVPEPATPISAWGQRNGVPTDTIDEARDNGVHIFRDSQDAPVYDLVSKSVSNILHSTGFDPAAIDFVLVAHTSSFPVIPGPGDIIRRLQRDFGMTRTDGFSIGQQNCVSIVSAIRIASTIMSQDGGVENVLIVSADQIRSEIDEFRLLGTTAIQSDGGSALILSRRPSNMRLAAAYNYSDTANWLGRLDQVESNKSFFFYNVRLIRRLLKEARLNPEDLASCITPNINREVWSSILGSSQVDSDLIDDSQFDAVGHVFGNDWIISLTESKVQGPILCLSYGLCDCFGGVIVDRIAPEGIEASG